MTYVAIWFPVLILSVLGGILVRRRLYRELPLFFSYVLFASLIGLVRYAAEHFTRAYFYVYWFSELAGAVFVTLALYEVLLRRMFVGFQRIRVYRIIFPVAAAITLILTILSALEASDRSAAFLRASRAFDFVRTAILLFFIGLMLLMGRVWSRYDLGVSLGFGLQAAAALANAAIRTRLPQSAEVLDAVELATYNLSCLIWLAAFWKPENPREPPESEMLNPAVVEEARSWESVLKNWLQPRKGKQTADRP